MIAKSLFSKSSVFKMFSVHTKNKKLAFSNSSCLRSVFVKAPLSAWISVDGRPNHRNTAAFSNFSGVVYPGPKPVFNL